MATKKRNKKYVSLLSVLVVLACSFALIGILSFAGAFIYRLIHNDGPTFDVFNLDAGIPAFILIFSIISVFIVLFTFVLRSIYILNHPVTTMVTGFFVLCENP